MRQVRRRYDPLRLLRLLTLATNCCLAQDMLMYFAAIAPQAALPSSSWLRSLGASLDGVLLIIAFAESPVACSRGGPPPGISSSHSPDTSCSNSPSLLS